MSRSSELLSEAEQATRLESKYLPHVPEAFLSSMLTFLSSSGYLLFLACKNTCTKTVCLYQSYFIILFYSILFLLFICHF